MKILFVFFMPIFMFAHSLSVTASYEDKELFIESFFGDGSACKACAFKVKKGDEVIYNGNLLEDGSFEESVELEVPFSVSIDGGMGHWADVSIDGSEMAETTADLSNDTTSSLGSIDEKRLREIIKSELNKQNAKIESMLEKNKSTLEKTLVGLGYILGIFGLWQLFARRNQE